jgi:hypothetical protein
LTRQNTKGNEIFYPVNDNSYREWARGLEWAIKKHSDIAQEELDQLTEDYTDVILQSKPPRKCTSENTINSILLLCTSALNGRTRGFGLMGLIHL